MEFLVGLDSVVFPEILWGSQNSQNGTELEWCLLVLFWMNLIGPLSRLDRMGLNWENAYCFCSGFLLLCYLICYCVSSLRRGSCEKNEVNLQLGC